MDNIVFFDGECAMCNGFVLFVLDNDKKDKVRFMALQSEEALNILSKHSIILEKDNLTTIYYLSNDVVLSKSNAILTILIDIQFFTFFAYCAKWIPKFVRDGVYQFIAKRRYLFFNDKKECRLLTAQERKKILA